MSSDEIAVILKSFDAPDEVRVMEIAKKFGLEILPPPGA